MWADFDAIASGEKIAASDSMAISALEVPFAVYGRSQPVPAHHWRQITHLAGLFGGRENPLESRNRQSK